MKLSILCWRCLLGCEVAAAEDFVAGLLNHGDHARCVHADEAALPLSDFPGDEHCLDVAGIHEIDDRALGIIARPDIQPVGTQNHEIGVFAGRQTTCFPFERGAAGTLNGVEGEDFAWREQRR